MKDMIARLYVTLLDVDPAILHHFEIGGILYGEPSPDDAEFDSDIVDERKLKLVTLAEEGDRLFEYVYDYGDNWCCAIVIEALQPALSGIVYPRLVEGARRGPPEDIGGPPGYEEFLEAIGDPKHERHAELIEWSGEDFDPECLSIDDINAALSQLAKPKGTRAKKAPPRFRIEPARKHRGFHPTLTLLVGLVVVILVPGHAATHLYRRVVAPADGEEMAAPAGTKLIRASA